MTDKEFMSQPTTLQEAINIIQFLKISHKQEISKWKESYQKQVAMLKKIELIRKKELEFLSQEIIKYELNLASKSEAIAKELKEKDDIIQQQLQTIGELNERIKMYSPMVSLPEITVINTDCYSDSGIVLENEDITSSSKGNDTIVKTVGKRRRFAESISFFRRVDFTPRKCKERSDIAKPNEELKSNKLEVPLVKPLRRRSHNNDGISDDDRLTFTDSGSVENLVFNSKPINESMNNHFSDDGSDDTSEEIFDRVMTRSSVRRSVKTNPKYKKINRTKSKLLIQLKNIAVD